MSDAPASPPVDPATPPSDPPGPPPATTTDVPDSPTAAPDPGTPEGSPSATSEVQAEPAPQAPSGTWPPEPIDSTVDGDEANELAGHDHLADGIDPDRADAEQPHVTAEPGTVPAQPQAPTYGHPEAGSPVVVPTDTTAPAVDQDEASPPA